MGTSSGGHAKKAIDYRRRNPYENVFKVYNLLLRTKMGIPEPDKLTDEEYADAVGFMLHLMEPKS